MAALMHDHVRRIDEEKAAVLAEGIGQKPQEENEPRDYAPSRKRTPWFCGPAQLHHRIKEFAHAGLILGRFVMQREVTLVWPDSRPRPSLGPSRFSSGEAFHP